MITIEESDDEAAFAQVRLAWVEEDDGHPVEDLGFAADFSRWWTAERDHRRMWLARLDDHPVGMLNLIMIDHMPRPGRPHSWWGYLSHLYVLPTERNAGIGGKLIAACVQQARAAGMSRIVLHPAERARPLYARAGFAVTDDLLALPLG